MLFLRRGGVAGPLADGADATGDEAGAHAGSNGSNGSNVYNESYTSYVSNASYFSKCKFSV